MSPSAIAEALDGVTVTRVEKVANAHYPPARQRKQT